MADERDEELSKLRARVAELEAGVPPKRLLESEELMRRTIAAIPGGIVHVAADGAILSANPEALRILGLSYDALTRRYTRDFDPETLREDGTPCPMDDYPVTRALVTGEPQAPETIGVKRPNGSIAWAIFTAVPVKDPITQETVSAVVTFLDITARREMEATLRDREALLRSVLASAPNPIAYTDRAGLVRYVNRPTPGATFEALVGKPVWDIVGSAADAGVAQATFAEVMATREIRQYETQAFERHYLVTVGPVLEGEETVGATFVGIDVTEERALEAKVLIADRMAAIGTLTAGIAHEINNPLTYVLANIAWLSKMLGGEPSALDRLAAVREGAERIRTIVADVSTLSHAGESRDALVDLHDTIESALRIADTTVRQRARVVKELGPLPPVRGSEARLGQVFLNLVVNAAQAIGDGDPSRDTITIRTAEIDGRAVVTVEDTGPGIVPEMRDRIFDPFVTSKPVGSGTGLGLYICRNVVAAHGGEIAASNGHNGGARFVVSLPAARLRHEDPIADVPSTSRAFRRLSILVVDDERAIVTILSKLLVDHEVVPAYDGEDAIAILRERRFDLVLCDLMMPRKTGMEVFEFVREHRPGDEERIVFITGGALTDRARSFLRATENQVLDKPFGPESLDAVVARAASRARTHHS